MKRERVVFDTNVLISGALASTSTPALALERAISDGQLLASTATLRELMEKLLSTKFDPYVSREKRDADKFLEVAVNGRADVLVTGDGDLLELNPFRGIAILTPADFIGGQTLPVA